MSGIFPRWKPPAVKASAPATPSKPGAAWIVTYEDEVADLIEKEDYPAAEARLMQEVARIDKTSSAIQRIRVRLKLALVRRRQAAADPESLHLKAAEKIIRQAIALAAQEKHAPSYLQCLDELAEVFELQGNWAAVGSSLRQAVKIQSASRRPDLASASRRLQRLAVAEHRLDNAEAAVKASKEALRLIEQLHGEDNLEVGNLLAETGRFFRAQGAYKEAEEYLRRALRIHRKHLGDGCPQVISDLQQLASTLEESGDLTGAAQEYEKCLSIKQRQLGLVHIDELGLMQFSLANVYVSWGNLARARELLQEAVGAFRPAGGARLAVALEILAQVEEASGRYALALKELEAAAKAWEKCGSERTVELMRNMEYRVGLLVDMKKMREAGYLREKVEAMARKLEEEAAVPDEVEEELFAPEEELDPEELSW
jgi:tetratricopeptide (TPR) repeat protein